MAECKTACSFFVRLHLKSKIGGQEEITTEADDITDGVGYRLIHIVYQQQIDRILNGDGDTTDNSESEKFYNFLFLNHFLSDSSND